MECLRSVLVAQVCTGLCVSVFWSVQVYVCLFAGLYWFMCVRLYAGLYSFMCVCVFAGLYRFVCVSVYWSVHVCLCIRLTRLRL